MPLSIGDLPVGPLTKGLKVVFKEAYDKALASGESSKIAMVSPSNSDSEDYAWMGAIPKVREFLGERQAKSLANFSYNLKNKTWENTLAVPRTLWEDQKMGQIKQRVQQLAHEAARYKDELVWSFLAGALGSAAAPYLCYDGQGLFDTDHPAPIGGSAQDNKDASALSYANLWLAIDKMTLYQDDQGRYLHVKPTHLIVEPCLQSLGMDLCYSDKNVDSATANTAMRDNSIKKYGLELMVVPELYTTATVANGNWMLVDASGVVKPVILQERTPVEFGSLMSDSDQGFIRDEYLFGSRARYNVGSGFWPYIYGNTGAG